MPKEAPKELARRIISWRPDLVWCHHGRSASNAVFLEKLRREGIKTAVYLCDEPYESGETCRYSPGFDYVFSMDIETVEAHRLSRINRSPNVFYLPAAADTTRFKPSSYGERPIKALFLGNANLAPRPKYLRPLEKLIDGVDIRFWGSTKKTDPKWVPHHKHYELYSSCLVGLNVHRSPWMDEKCYKGRILGRSPQMRVPAGIKLSYEKPKEWGTGFWNDGNLPASHVNPRFFEMAACGTLVVNDDTRSELARMFPMAPQAESSEHFFELVSYYLNNAKEAEELGAACSWSISKRHSYRHRAAEVLIRVGLKELDAEDLRSCLGEPLDYLTPQLSELRRDRSSSEQIGRLERWSPQYGKWSIRQFTNTRELTSIDVPILW